MTFFKNIFISKQVGTKVTGTVQGMIGLTGDNLKVIVAKFSTLIQAILLHSNTSAWHTHTWTLRELETQPMFLPVK